ncbi:MAG: tail fiber domain-containing protein [Bacteroidales bacterium]|nr:tail fiber domain-containing protein [Bacteroidales bacterium]
MITIGVKGVSRWNPNGKNYGVYGTIGISSLLNYCNGAGILGTISDITYPILSSRYAGYFIGDVNITTKLTVNTITYNSDYRYKQNIEELDRKKTFVNVLNLNPIEYNFKQKYFDAVDSLGKAIKVEYFDEKSQIFQKKHFGLIAQEVQKLYLDLVYDDGDGYLSVDYIGIIPLLIQSVKELNTQIEQLKIANVGAILKNQTIEQNEQYAMLYQTTSNLFSQNTEMKYYLPTATNNAFLCIYDLSGKQLKQYPLLQRNYGSQIIPASELSAGIYLYALYC